MMKYSILFVILLLPISTGQSHRGRKNKSSRNFCKESACQLKDHFTDRFNAINSRLDHLTEYENDVTKLQRGINALSRQSAKFEKKLDYVEKSSKSNRKRQEELKKDVETLVQDYRRLDNKSKALTVGQYLLDGNVKNIKLELIEINNTMIKSITDLYSTVRPFKSNSNSTVNLTNYFTVVKGLIAHLQGVIQNVEKYHERNVTKFDNEISALRHTTTEIKEQNKFLRDKVSHLEETMQQLLENQTMGTGKRPINCWLEVPANRGLVVTLDGQTVSASTWVSNGKTIQYGCVDQIYEIRGASEVTCNSGMWTDGQPRCTLKLAKET